MGAADGLRSLCCGEVLVRGRRCRLVGAMSLEHTRIDLSHVPDAERGDEVIVAGRQGKDQITADEVAQETAWEAPGWAW